MAAADQVALRLHHLAQVGVERFHTPTLAKVGQPSGVEVHAGDEFHVARFHDRRGVCPRPRIMGFADVLVVNGAAHAAAADDRGAVVAFGRACGHFQIGARPFPIRIVRTNSHDATPCIGALLQRHC